MVGGDEARLVRRLEEAVSSTIPSCPTFPDASTVAAQMNATQGKKWGAVSKGPTSQAEHEASTCGMRQGDGCPIGNVEVHLVRARYPRDSDTQLRRGDKLRKGAALQCTDFWGIPFRERGQRTFCISPPRCGHAKLQIRCLRLWWTYMQAEGMCPCRTRPWKLAERTCMQATLHVQLVPPKTSEIPQNQLPPFSFGGRQSKSNVWQYVVTSIMCVRISCRLLWTLTQRKVWAAAALIDPWLPDDQSWFLLTGHSAGTHFGASRPTMCRLPSVHTSPRVWGLNVSEPLPACFLCHSERVVRFYKLCYRSLSRTKIEDFLLPKGCEDIGLEFEKVMETPARPPARPLVCGVSRPTRKCTCGLAMGPSSTCFCIFALYIRWIHNHFRISKSPNLLRSSSSPGRTSEMHVVVWLNLESSILPLIPVCMCCTKSGSYNEHGLHRSNRPWNQITRKISRPLCERWFHASLTCRLD